jgi:hypothetical protein
VVRSFDPDKNESMIETMLFNPNDLQVLFDPDRPAPDLRLYKAEYTYAGTTPSRPASIAFVFVPLNKYKTGPQFSVILDGTPIHQGDATLREWCCVKVNGRNANPQHVVASIPLEFLERIRQAKKTEIKLATERGKYSFKLNDYQKKCLTALANTIK